MRMHREHLDKNETTVAPCKLNFDSRTAKELLLLAPSLEEQKHWVMLLGKRIQKCGYKAHQAANDGSKVSPRWVSGDVTVTQRTLAQAANKTAQNHTWRSCQQPNIGIMAIDMKDVTY